jgi:hypothetical protein
MSQLMALLEATKITLDNREELVVDLSTEMVEKDLQVEQMSNEILPRLRRSMRSDGTGFPILPFIYR